MNRLPYIAEIPSSGGCLTLHCPSNLISLVDTTFHTFLNFSYINFNNGTKRNKASTKVATEFPFSREAFQNVVSSVLRRVYERPRHAAKSLSCAAGIDVKTARSYLDGQRMPSGYALFHLMVRCRELRDEINRRVAVVEAACKSASQTNNKTNNSVRSDDAEYWLRCRVQARVGCCQTWRHENVALYPSILLVDAWPDIGRAGCERAGASARERRPKEGDSGAHPVED